MPMVLAKRPPLRRLSRYLQQRLAENTGRFAYEIVLDNTQRVMERLSYDGTAQKENAPSTIKRKGHSVPLLETGMLSNPFLYTINDVSAVTAKPTTLPIIIRPPPLREDILGYLAAKGYRFFGISSEVRGRAAEFFGEMLPSEFR